MAIPLSAGPGRVIRASKHVEDLYLVVLDERMTSRPQVPEVAQRLTREHGAQLRYVMNNAANIFSMKATPQKAAALAHNPFVLSVEEVDEVYLSAVQTLPPPFPIGGKSLWNLDRIDQLSPTLDNRFQYCERARDVTAYIADYGVMGDHQEFLRADGTSRVKQGVCFADDCGQKENRGDLVCPTGPYNGTTIGQYNHGTSVASILGGKTVGVAKDVSIVPLRISSCGSSNTVSTTERFCWALDWIRSSSNPDRNRRPALVSLSAYVRANEPLLSAFEYVINGLVNNDTTTGWTGIPVIVSANNQGSSTCRTSPARLAWRNRPSVALNGQPSTARVISVGGTTRNDTRWQSAFGDPNAYQEFCTAADGSMTFMPAGSNHGNTVDIYAPADDVPAADCTATNAYRSFRNSGTSFSAPLVAGIAARLLQVEPTLTPAQLWTRIQQYAQTVSPPIDTSGVSPTGQTISNGLLAVRRYASATCSGGEFP